MYSEIALGLTVSLGAMLVHLAGTLSLLKLETPFAHMFHRRVYVRLTIALITAYVVLLAAHMLEVALWGGLYGYLGLVSQQDDAFYSAFVNYTTLGYGDSLQTTKTRLLGPFASANGILMFGWSTAVLVLVVQRFLPGKISAK